MTDPDEVIQYLVFRADLGMGKGKLVAQGGHGVHLVIRDIERHGSLIDKQWLQQWESTSYTKIALKVASLDHLHALHTSLQAHEIRHVIVVDEGRTSVEPNTTTAIVLQPIPRSRVQDCIGSLKLL